MFIDSLIKAMDVQKLVIFDLDDTLYVEPNRLGDDVLWCLEYLKNKGHLLAIASHNLEGELLLRRFDILDYFSVVECFVPPGQTKMPLIYKILEATKKNPSDVIFFDDLPVNIAEVSAAGIHSVRVDCYTGVTWMDLHEAGL